MTLNDVDAVYDIEKSAYPFPWAKSIFEQAIASTKHTVVLESENKICGYGVVSYVVGEAELLNICVAPFAQGSGFGQQLLAYLINLPFIFMKRRVLTKLVCALIIIPQSLGEKMPFLWH
jgi:ribosomal-protein-alanine N-acetyltransferase